MRSYTLISILLIAFTSLPSLLQAQILRSDEMETILEDVAKQIRSGYIYEDQGLEISEAFLKQTSGMFNEDWGANDFAKEITTILLEISDDPHLYVRVSEEASAQRRRVMRPMNSEEPANERRLVLGPRVIENYGFEEVRVLDGNIGYLKFSMFSQDENAIEIADAAIQFLGATDALIIDLRTNFGGSPNMVLHLSSYLFEEPTHLSTSFQRGWEKPVERWTSDTETKNSLSHVPVYVLTSNRTFSAAESFTFGLNNNDRVTIVGETTGGGGHFGSMVDLSNNFQMFLPTGRVWNPKTGKGFQSEGITPHVEVNSEMALETAINLIKKG